MRISDWSSEVCPSDLHEAHKNVGGNIRDRLAVVVFDTGIDEKHGQPPAIDATAQRGDLFRKRDVDCFNFECAVGGFRELAKSFCGALPAGRDYPPATLEVSLGPCQAQAPGRTDEKIGRAHVCTPVTNAQLVCRLLLEKKNKHTHN